MEIRNARETPSGILSFFRGWGGGGDLVATKESNFQSPEHLNHSYQPGMSYRNAVRDTYTKTPRHAGGGGGG